MQWAVEVFQIIGSVATAFALFFVAKSTVHSKTVAESANKQLILERQRDRESQVLQLRNQANRMVSWPAIHGEEQDALWGVVVSNGSDAPVFDLTVRRKAGRSQSKRVLIDSLDIKVSVLPPGTYFFSPKIHVPFLIGRDDFMDPIVKNSDYMAEIQFRDCQSQKWVRDRQGILSQLEDENLSPSNS